MLVSSGRNWDLWDEIPFLGTAPKHYRLNYIQSETGQQLKLWLHLVHMMSPPSFASVLCVFLCICAEYLRKGRHLDH